MNSCWMRCIEGKNRRRWAIECRAEQYKKRAGYSGSDDETIQYIKRETAFWRREKGVTKANGRFYQMNHRVWMRKHPCALSLREYIGQRAAEGNFLSVLLSIKQRMKHLIMFCCTGTPDWKNNLSIYWRMKWEACKTTRASIERAGIWQPYCLHWSLGMFCFIDEKSSSAKEAG